MRRVKIVVTLGPASCSAECIEKLLLAGANVFRLNFSHGSHEEYAKTIQTLREVSQKCEQPLAILQDLQGPKMRLGSWASGPIKIKRGQRVILKSVDGEKGRGGEGEKESLGVIPVEWPRIHLLFKVGYKILIDDGRLKLMVERIQEQKVFCKVIHGGFLQERKGVSLPRVPLPLKSLTEKDKRDLKFGLQQGVDYVALSFVREVNDIQVLRRLIQKWQPSVSSPLSPQTELKAGLRTELKTELKVKLGIKLKR